MTSSAKICLGVIFTNDSTEYVCQCMPWGQTMVNEMVEKTLEQIKKTLVMPNVLAYGATL